MGKEIQRSRRTGFFLSVNQRKSRSITQEKAEEIKYLYSIGYEIPELCKRLDIKPDTLRKAIKSGRIILIKREREELEKGLTKSERSQIDNEQGMGKCCVNSLDRVLSIKTGVPCTPSFTDQIDLHQAGVLLSIPALLSNGLLKHQQDFNPDRGYYSLSSIFISLAFLSLLRVKTLAQSINIPAGELGKAIGLDRIPEVKTLRERIALFCQKTNVEAWSLKLSKDWMVSYPELSGVLYIDGHVNIYYGANTEMPKRYVSRLRLCMSGSTDYWVNDMLGQPFFVVNKTINSSMIETIKTEIIPKLDIDIPNQPTEKELIENPLLHRYMLVFDRECYSIDFFIELWEQKIAICTYNKNVKEEWTDEEFIEYTEELPNGEKNKIMLAERAVLLQSKTTSKKIWVREIRKKSESGHQTSILTTNYILTTLLIGIYMFARWSQENFFKYIIENFGIDYLVSYMKRKIADTSMLVNPEYRDLENLQKKWTSKLTKVKTKFASLLLADTPIDDKKMKTFIKKKSELNEQIKYIENIIAQIKQKKTEIPRKIAYSKLPDNQKFDTIINERKFFLDTIKMIAYRAETSMANIIKPMMAHPGEARTLLKQVYQSDANIFVDNINKTLTVELHRLNYRKDDMIIEELCSILNESQTVFPDSDLILNFKLVSS